ncbi:MAG: insulinase family protein [Armatimonadetes bacterium]|nr:insulinase family protein [Armatimonadota bacterium]
MFVAILLTAALAQVRDSPQQKTTLPNGVVLYAEEMPRANGFTLHLFVSTLGHPEPEGQRGHRHFLEHIVAKGRDRDIDAKLEVLGLTLTADTLRDGIRFEIEGAPGQFNAAVQSLRQLVADPDMESVLLADLTDDTVAREIEIIRQELAVRTVQSKLTAALWTHAFGDQATDPYGTAEGRSSVSADSLRAVYRRAFKAGAMTVVVAGKINAAAAIESLKRSFEGLDATDPAEPARRRAAEPDGVLFVPGVPGAGRAVVVGSLTDPATITVIAAALAVQSEVPGAVAVYTPGPFAGLVSVVHPRRSGFADVDRTVSRDGVRLFSTGRAAVRAWVDAIDDAPREKARVYGQMLLLERGFRLNDLKARAARLDQASFAAALRKFHSASCVRVGGSR